jgi:hypothetical protein
MVIGAKAGKKKKVKYDTHIDRLATMVRCIGDVV